MKDIVACNQKLGPKKFVLLLEDRHDTTEENISEKSNKKDGSSV